MKQNMAAPALTYTIEGFNLPENTLASELERITAARTRGLAWTYLRELFKYTREKRLRLPPKAGPICAFLASEKYACPLCISSAA